MTWVLTIDEVPPSGNLLKRMHWARYSALLWSWWWWIRTAEGFQDIPKATRRRRVVITRHGRGALDRDNLYAAVKPVVDVLRPAKHEAGTYKTGKKAGQPWTRERIGHGLILEDDVAHLDLEVFQDQLQKGQVPHITIEIEDWP